MIRVGRFKVQYVCPECHAKYSYETNSAAVEATSLYDQYIGRHGKKCPGCGYPEVDIREVVAIRADRMLHRYEILWQCLECGDSWLEYEDLTDYQFHKDKDLVLELMENTECPDPYCGMRQFYVQRLTMIN